MPNCELANVAAHARPIIKLELSASLYEEVAGIAHAHVEKGESIISQDSLEKDSL